MKLQKIMIPQKSGKIINICSLFSYLGDNGHLHILPLNMLLPGSPKLIVMN